MELGDLKEIIQELDNSAKLIRELVANLIKLRRSLLKAYSSINRIIGEAPAPREGVTVAVEKAALPAVLPPEGQQAVPEEGGAKKEVETRLELQEGKMEAKEAAVEVIGEGEAALMVKKAAESINVNPQVSNVINELRRLKEELQKKIPYHPVFSEITLTISKLQAMPGEGRLDDESKKEMLNKLSEWASRLS